MKSFKDFLTEQALNESKEPHSFVIKLVYPYMIPFGFDKDLRTFAEWKFGAGTVVRTDISSTKEDRNGNHKHQFSIIPNDKSSIVRQTIPEIVKFFSDSLSYNLSPEQIKVSIVKAELSLENIEPGSELATVYKRLFGTRAPRVGQTISAAKGTGKQIYKVVNIVSNDLIVCESYFMQGSSRIRGDKHWIFVRGEGAWQEKHAPSQYRNHF